MKDYFDGYYFKAQSQEKTLAVIAAYHISNGKASCSVQLISDSGVWSAVYPGEKFHKARSGIGMRLCGSVFTEKGLRLDIDTEGLRVTGGLKFGSLSPIRYDIMGPFRFVPFMECRHTVVSMRHRVDGCIVINGEEYRFSDAVGYIEGDRGTSFPKVYSWTQCNFENGSLMLSVADIPIGSLHFTGLIGVIMRGENEKRIATYLGARAVKIKSGELVVKQGKTVFTAKLIEKRGRPLAAPVSGSMIRTIHESACCRAEYRLTENGIETFALDTDRASFEYEFPE